MAGLIHLNRACEVDPLTRTRIRVRWLGQPQTDNMERALGSLHQALGSLRESTANKGGHRGRAMELVQQAIEETQAGIDFADDHGGGH
jgi:hypothetical protein